MNGKPNIVHNLNKYGYVNVSYENKLGVYKLSDKAESCVKVYCDYSDLDEVESQIKRHVDDVNHTSKVIDGNEQIFVIKEDQDNYYNSHFEAILAKLDADEELESLYSEYKYTLSNKPDDTVQGSATGRTTFSAKGIDKVIEDLCRYPYIHKLQGFTEEQCKDLYQLSLRIQKQLCKPREIRAMGADWK